MLINCFTSQECESLNDRLLTFEKDFAYDADGHKFCISHGLNYLTFFKELRFNYEDPLFFVAQNKEGEILGIIVAVLQNIPFQNDFIKTWYLCDFKIKKTSGSFLILLKLLQAVKEKCYPICKKAYALSMNPKHAQNRVLAFAQRNKFIPFQDAGNINIYELTKNLCTPSFLDKNLWVYQSTYSKTILINNVALDLWHIVEHPKKNAILLKENLDLFKEDTLILYTGLIKNISPWGSCAILQTGLDFIDWSFIKSCDI